MTKHWVLVVAVGFFTAGCAGAPAVKNLPTHTATIVIHDPSEHDYENELRAVTPTQRRDIRRLKTALEDPVVQSEIARLVYDDLYPDPIIMNGYDRNGKRSLFVIDNTNTEVGGIILVEQGNLRFIACEPSESRNDASYCFPSWFPGSAHPLTLPTSMWGQFHLHATHTLYECKRPSPQDHYAADKFSNCVVIAANGTCAGKIGFIVTWFDSEHNVTVGSYSARPKGVS